MIRQGMIFFFYELYLITGLDAEIAVGYYLNELAVIFMRHYAEKSVMVGGRVTAEWGMNKQWLHVSLPGRPGYRYRLLWYSVVHN